MNRAKDIAQHHIRHMAGQSVLAFIREQIAAEDQREGGAVRHVEEGKRADLPVEFQRRQPLAKSPSA